MPDSRQTDSKLSQLQTQVTSLSKRTARQLWFLFAVFLLLVVLSLLSAWRYADHISAKLDALTSITHTASVPRLPKRDGDDTNDVPEDSSSGLRIDSLDSRLGSLEQIQEAMVSASKGALEQMNFVFGVVAAFFGLFALYFSYRQMMTDATKDSSDQEIRGLVGSFRENMTVINSLITTLEQSFRHRAHVDQQITKIESDLEDVASFRRDTEQGRASHFAELNRDAWALFCSVNRDNFKNETNKGGLDNFHIKMSTLGRSVDSQQVLSPFCYFARALHFFNATQYPLASVDLETARESASKHLSNRSRAQVNLTLSVLDSEVRFVYRRDHASDHGHDSRPTLFARCRFDPTAAVGAPRLGT